MLIGLTGPKQAGKDTVYERARHIMDGVLTVERVSFADLLYRSAAASLGVTVEELGRWKNDPAAFVSVKAPREPRRSQTVRQYLQAYGTEAHRQVFGSSFWVDAVDLEHEGRLVIVTDVRFENEADAVVRAGGVIVKVVGPPNVEDNGDGHASEAGLPAECIDFWLQNTVRDDGFRSLDRHLDTVLRLVLRERS